MSLARDALRLQTMSISNLAFAIGYASESAFSTAFRRVVACLQSSCATGQSRPGWLTKCPDAQRWSLRRFDATALATAVPIHSRKQPCSCRLEPGNALESPIGTGVYCTATPCEFCVDKTTVFLPFFFASYIALSARTIIP